MNSLFLVLFSLLFLAINAFAQTSVEQGVAVTNIKALKLLEQKGFSIDALLSQNSKIGILSNRELSKNIAFNPVFKSLMNEMNLYKTQNPDTGVGMKYGKRLFDINYLADPNARFVLVGLINRMDQAYKHPNTCGDIRFIYRLAYDATVAGKPVFSRLPMTINLIFRPTGDCSAMAQSLRDLNLDSEAKVLTDELTLNGPLSPSFFKRSSLYQLEVNLQIFRWPAGIATDFGGYAEYLLKVYKFSGKTFVESNLENQINRDALLKNPALMKEFKAWVFDSKNIQSIDQGTHLIPEKFLAKKAISISPGGNNRSGNRPF